MRLLVIVNVYRPDLGGGVLFADFCEGLSDRGFQVEVRCAYPYYPEWKDKTESNGMAISGSREHGVHVRRFGIFIPRNPASLLQRMLYEASFFFSLARELPKPGDYDLVMAYCPLVGAVAYGSVAATSAGCPLWLNVQDLSADAAAAAGIVRSKGIAALFRGIQRFLFNRAHAWSTISPVMRDRLTQSASKDQDVHYLPNWLHGSLANAIARAPTNPSPGRGPARLLYSGNIGAKQNLLQFCQALGQNEIPFFFRVQGAGAGASMVRDWIQQSDDPRFEFHPLGSEASLAEQLKSADLFVVTEKPGAGGSFIPSKLLPAYGAGAAVLAVCDQGTPLEREMAEAAVGPSIRWEQLDKVHTLLQDPDGLRDAAHDWHRASQARAQHFSRERIIDAYADLLRSVAQADRTR